MAGKRLKPVFPRTGIIFGGDLSVGKTSNLELDKVFSRYLPVERLLPCSTLPYIDSELAETIRAQMRRSRVIYFPLFIRHHWIAGFLSLEPDGSEHLEFCDSAPSPIVHKDLRRSLKRVWPALFIHKGKCAKQKPGSDDCGLYMAANFFADYLKVGVADHRTIAPRLRKLLFNALKRNTGRTEFLEKMEQELLRGPQLEGGAPKPSKHRNKNHSRDAIEVNSNDSTPIEHEEPRSFPLFEADDIAAFEAPTGEPLDPFMMDTSEDINAQPSTVTNTSATIDSVTTHLRRVQNDFNKALAAARRRKIGYCLAAVALANASDGETRSMTIENVGGRVYSYKFGKWTPRDINDPLSRIGKRIHVWTPEGVSKTLGEEETAGWIVRTASGRKGTLPRVIKGRTFRIGASFEGWVSAKEADIGTYDLTTDVSQAIVGVYLPEGMQEYPPQRGRSNTPNPPSRRASAPTTNENEKTVEEQHQEVLETEPQQLLNSEGSPDEAPVTCPRTWHIFSQRPPHVSAIAWAGVTPAIRQHHIRCLRKLQMMPAELLKQSIVSTVIECVRREALSAGWKPPTIDKELSAMAGALRDLPLYTTERRGYLLRQDPEWVAATVTMKRMVREHVTDPPAPVTWEQYCSALRSLQGKNPLAALFLAMTWAMAARAGDVATLRAQDVRLDGKVRSDGTYGFGVTQRFGKGTKFRGTYGPASTLQPENARELQRLLNQRSPKAKLFPNVESLKDLVRAALKIENRQAALPSVRKGAIRHLAAMGVPEADLMRLTGHTRLETLHRYLGYGLPQTREAVTAQDNAALVHHPPPNGPEQEPPNPRS